MRTMFRSTLAALALVIAFAMPTFAQATLNKTTLSVAITSATTTFINLTSVSNVTAGDVLFTDGEAMLVQATPSANPVQVRRGYDGTAATTHLVNASVWTGVPSRFVSKDPLPGSCTPATVSQLALPVINTRNGFIWDCAKTDATAATPTFKWQAWSPVSLFENGPRTAVLPAGASTYTVVLSDYIVALVGPLTSATSVTQGFTLPSHVGLAGKVLVFKDETGAISATTFINLIGTINGATSFQLRTAFGSMSVYAGSAGWFSFAGDLLGPR